MLATATPTDIASAAAAAGLTIAQFLQRRYAGARRRIERAAPVDVQRREQRALQIAALEPLDTGRVILMPWHPDFAARREEAQRKANRLRMRRDARQRRKRREAEQLAMEMEATRAAFTAAWRAGVRWYMENHMQPGDSTRPPAFGEKFSVGERSARRIFLHHLRVELAAGGVTRAEFFGDSRVQRISLVRHRVWIACHGAGLGFNQIARLSGGRDHTSIRHAVEKHRQKQGKQQEQPA